MAEESLPPASSGAPPADGPLTARIGPDTSPVRATALRMSEHGRALLAAGEPGPAAELLERAVEVDGTAPYAYYLLAEAHHRGGRAELAWALLDRAEQKLDREPYWLGRVWALRGILYEQEGDGAAARAAYRRALDLWPADADAGRGLMRLRSAGDF